jgi:hypothetical protein
LKSSSNQETFSRFGTKGGSFIGVLTGASFMVPKSGDYADQTRVVALFMNDLSLGAFLRLNETFAQQDFERKIATDADFAKIVSERLGSL